MKKAYLLLLALLVSVASFGIGAITGIPTVCVGTTDTLANGTPGGAWTSSNMAVATVGATTGVVTGIAAGSATITYTVGAARAVLVISVFSSMPPIEWPDSRSLCLHVRTNEIRNAFIGGVYTSSDTSIVKIINSSDRSYADGVAVGSAVVTYSSAGCGYATITVTVMPLAILSGKSFLCVGDTTTYHTDVPGGFWFSGSRFNLFVDSATGFAKALLRDTYAPIYRAPNGCYSYFTVTIGDTARRITGPSSVCVASTIDLKSGGGWGHTWTSNNPAVATVIDRSIDGPVTGVAAGTAIITYSTNEHCMATQTVTVTPASCSGAPTPGIAAVATIGACAGAADTLSLTGYTSCGTRLQWQSSPDSITWTDIPGASYAPFRYSPLTSGYVRCKNTCIASGLSAFSNKVYLSKHSGILGHSILHAGSICPSTNFRVKVCGVSNTLTLITRYGDGLADTITPRYVAPDCDASLTHNYGISGRYRIQHVLLEGSTFVDSISYDYDETTCYIMPISYYFDRDSDCTFSNVDFYNYTPIKTVIDSNGVPIDTIAISGGIYYTALGPGGTVYTFRPILVHTGLRILCPSSGIIRDTVYYSGSTAPVKYFALACDTTSGMDLSVSPVYSVGRSTFQGNIFASNSFRTLQSATVTMTFSPKYRCELAWPAGTISGNTITWRLTGLAGNLRPGYLFFRCVYRDSLLAIGDTVQNRITITPTTGDADITNNTYYKADTVRASYDPNTIEVSPSSLVLPCDELLYTVHFENTGNDTAHNIHVMDTLSDNVELRGMQIVSAPEGMQLAYTTAGGHNVVKFDFPGINLPDSSHHGQNMAQFSFKVKVKNGLPDGVTIPNRVGIYFDDNDVVMTNQVENTIGMAPIAGPDSVCSLGQIALTCATPGGVWTASNTRATVAGGIVTGLSTGIDTIIYTVTNACVSRSSAKAVTISNKVFSASITRSSSGSFVCAGTPVTFTAISTNGGNAPRYLWKVNGAPTDTTMAMTYLPANNDVVTLKVNGSHECAYPLVVTDEDTLVVKPIIQPGVTITGLPAGLLLSGTPVTLAATPTDAGAATVYQWLLNGAAINGATAATYVVADAANGDSVSCVVTPLGDCAGMPAKATVVFSVAVSSGAPAIIPNPTKGTFTVIGLLGNNNLYKNGDVASITVKNIVGQQVYSTTTTITSAAVNATLQLPANLPKGNYVLILRAADKNHVLGFVLE